MAVSDPGSAAANQMRPEVKEEPAQTLKFCGGKSDQTTTNVRETRSTQFQKTRKMRTLSGIWSKASQKKWMPEDEAARLSPARLRDSQLNLFQFLFPIHRQRNSLAAAVVRKLLLEIGDAGNHSVVHQHDQIASLKSGFMSR